MKIYRRKIAALLTAICVTFSGAMSDIPALGGLDAAVHAGAITTDVQVEDCSYLLIGSTAQLSAYNGDAVDVVIPATITYLDAVYSVASVGVAAFKGTAVRTVVIPEGVLLIGGSAFAETASLEYVQLPTTLTAPATIGGTTAAAFYCSQENENAQLTAENSGVELRIGTITETGADDNYEYSRYGNAVTITKYVGAAVDVTLPEMINDVPVTEIGASAFEGTAVETVTIPDSITAIGENAFAETAALKYIQLPTTLTAPATIGGSTAAAFYCSQENENARLTAENSGVELRIGTITETGADDYYEYSRYGNAVTITKYVGAAVDVTLPEMIDDVPVTEIGASAFAGTAVETVTIPDSITAIGENAFAETAALKYIQLPTTLAAPCTIGGSTAAAFYCSQENENAQLTAENSGVELRIGTITETGADDYYEYSRYGNAVTITKYIGAAVDVTLPEMIDDVPVTEIGASAFAGTAVETVTIPDSITAIGENAFAETAALKYIQLPTTLTAPATIGGTTATAFYCSQENENARLTAENSGVELRIGTITETGADDNYEYSRYGNAVTITKYVGAAVDVTLPEMIDDVPVTEIGASAFAGTAVETVTIPDSITAIGENAFAETAALKYIQLPTTLTAPATIGGTTAAAFYCSQENENAQLTAENSGVELRIGTITETGADDYYEYSRYGNAVTITKYVGAAVDVTLPETINDVPVTEIGASAFAGTAVETVTIPDSITAIGENAFAETAALKYIQLPTTLTAPATIGGTTAAAFYCSQENENAQLTAENSGVELRIGCFPAVIEGETFTYERTETEVIIRAYVGEETEVEIPAVLDGLPVTKIADNAFKNTAITRAVIPENVTSIGSYAFYGCSALKSVNLPAGLCEIGSYAFFNTAITRVVIPEGVTEILSGTFCSCPNLITAQLHDGITAIGSNAFTFCAALEFMRLPENALTAEGVFEHCGKLTLYGESEDSYSVCYAKENSVPWSTDAMPYYLTQSGVTGIIYSDCAVITGVAPEITALTLDELGEKPITALKADALCVTALDTLTIGAGLSDLSWLSGLIVGQITLSADNTAYIADGGVIYTADRLTAVKPLTSAINTLSLHGEVSAIADGAFAGISIDTVVIPETVTSIGSRAFADCTSLAEAYIPTSIAAIGENAFAGCTSLVIYGESGSCTETYCGENGIRFFVAPTQPVELDGLLYMEYADYIKLCGTSSKYITSCTVRSRLSGKPVTAIADEAFAFCAKLKSITLPSTIGAIGKNAFKGCRSLETITLPSGITKIESSCFMDCVRLKKVVIPQSVTEIGDSSFAYCVSLEAAKLPDNLTVICDFAFYECKKLNTMLPSTVTEIGAAAFTKTCMNCALPSALTKLGDFAFDSTAMSGELVIPSGVTSMEEFAFGGCDGLTSVTIPDGCTQFDAASLAGCEKLTSITVSGENEKLISVDGVLYSKDMTVLYKYPAAKAHVSDYTIPATVTSIEFCAFECADIQTITIPSSVTFIGEDAFVGAKLSSVTVSAGVASIPVECFSGCTLLEHITLPETLNEISGYAFDGCTALVEINLPRAVKLIGNYAFNNCSSLSTVGTNSALEEIGMMTFAGCKKLTAIDLQGVTTIGDYAFYNTGLTELTLPASLKTVGLGTFRGCAALTEVNLNNGTEQIGDYAFYGTPLTTIYFPASLKNVSPTAFLGCTSLTAIGVDSASESYCSIGGIIYSKDMTELVIYPRGLKTASFTVPDGVKTIGAYCFYGNKSLTAVTLPEGLTKIGDYAFCSTKLSALTLPQTVTELCSHAFFATSITEITLPGSLVVMGSHLFSGTKLKTLNIPASVTTVDGNPLAQLRYLETLTVAQSNAFFKAQDGYLLSKDGTKLISYAVEASEIPEIPDGVSEIGSYAFYNNLIITGIKLPASVRVIDDSAFDACYSLTAVMIPDGVEYIGSYAFDCLKNGNFKQIYIPASVTYIADDFLGELSEDFYGELADFTLYGESGSEAEALSANALTYLNFVPSKPVTEVIIDGVTYSTYDGVTAAATAADDSVTALVIPKEVAFGESTLSITEVTAGALTATITSLTLPASVASIGSISGCSALTAIEIEVGNTVFATDGTSLYTADGKTLLAVIPTLTGDYTVHGGVTTIAENAFDGCLLSTITISAEVENVNAASFGSCSQLTAINVVPENIYYSSRDGLLYTSYRLLDAGIDCLLKYPAGKTAATFNLPLNVDIVDENVFDCPALTRINIRSATAEIFEDAFGTVNPLLEIHVVEGSNAQSGLALSGLNVIADLTARVSPDSLYRYVTEDGAVTITGYIGAEAVVTLPAYIDGSPVTAIASGAFAGTAVTEVRLPKSIISIGESAFDAGVTVVRNTAPAALGNPTGVYGGDSGIDSGDALLALKYSVSIETLDDEQLAAADVNGDGKVDSTDALIILKSSVGIITDLGENYVNG